MSEITLTPVNSLPFLVKTLDGVQILPTVIEIGVAQNTYTQPLPEMLWQLRARLRNRSPDIAHPTTTVLADFYAETFAREALQLCMTAWENWLIVTQFGHIPDIWKQLTAPAVVLSPAAAPPQRTPVNLMRQGSEAINRAIRTVISLIRTPRENVSSGISTADTTIHMLVEELQLVVDAAHYGQRSQEQSQALRDMATAPGTQSHFQEAADVLLRSRQQRGVAFNGTTWEPHQPASNQYLLSDIASRLRDTNLVGSPMTLVDPPSSPLDGLFQIPVTADLRKIMTADREAQSKQQCRPADETPTRHVQLSDETPPSAASYSFEDRY